MLIRRGGVRGKQHCGRIVLIIYFLTGCDIGRGSEDTSLDDKEHPCSHSFQSNTSSTSANISSTKITPLKVTLTADRNSEKNRSMINTAEQTVESKTHSSFRKSNQEVSRKGNGMGGSGWKAQICMNGISFCFKVGGFF